MPLDVNKIDDRIKKLQELRRIAVDQEMTALLSEFLVAGDAIPQAVSASSNSPHADPSLPPPNSDEVADIVKGVLDGSDSVPLGGPMPMRNLKKS